jgi:pimeloyl-ACP methyl ester carboxylesterase
MRVRVAPVLVGGVAVLAAGAATVSYRRDMAAAWERLGSVDRRTVQTRFGAVEYCEAGAGDPVLVSHGAFQGCDALATPMNVVLDARLIVPSRFGYLGSSLPEGATAADQADAFVELLDYLGVPQTDVLGLSAGTSAAVQMALRHPDRTRRLVVVSGNFPGSPTTQVPADGAQVMLSGPVIWAMRRLGRHWPVVARSMGIPNGFPRDAADTAQIESEMDSFFPVAPRRAGVLVDAYRTTVEVNDYPLEEVAVPTLVVHAVDDPLTSYEAAVAAVSRIPGAHLVSLDSGGHLLLGQTERLSKELDAFLAT